MVSPSHVGLSTWSTVGVGQVPVIAHVAQRLALEVGATASCFLAMAHIPLGTYVSRGKLLLLGFCLRLPLGEAALPLARRGGVAWDVLGLANGLAPMKESQYAVSSPEVKKPDPSRQWLAFSVNTKSEN